MCTIIKWGQCAWVVCQYTGPMLATQSILRPKHQDNTCWVIGHNTRTILYLSKNWLKGTVSWDFRHFFYIKKTPPGPHMIRQRWLHKIFCFYEDIHEKHMSTKSSTTRTRTRLHQHFQKTMKEGFPQILKEHSDEKRYLGVLANPIAII